MSGTSREPGAEPVSVLGVRVHALRRADLLAWVASTVSSGRRAQIMYANAHTLNIAYDDSELRAHMNQADIVYCDGAGVKIAARLLGHRLPERMTGADWIYDLCLLCQQEGFSLYFLGGERGVAARAAANLGQRYPGLRIAGAHHGFFERTGAENARLIAQINSAQPHILLVGLGTPLQEQWIAQDFAQLQAQVIWAVGALLDFVADREPRAPRWMLDHGLEWLGRLVAEPERKWRRYLLGNPLFLGRVLKQKMAPSRPGQGREFQDDGGRA